MLNSRDIDLLRPDVAANCHLWVERCRTAGLNVLVTNTVRDREYQAYLYEQGRTRPGGIVTNSPVPTFHADTSGLAFDFCKNVKGHEYDDKDFFREAAAIAKEMGFSWGGDWRSFVDLPHIQWDDGRRYTDSDIKAGRYPPEMPLWEDREEDGDMTQETFNQLMEGYFKAREEQEPSAWSAGERQWAEEKGLIQGSGEGGAKAYRAFLTREQAVVLLKRLHDLMAQS